MMDYEVLNRRIISQLKKFRKQKKLTQTELSIKIGKNNKYINSVESGIASISLKALVDISNVLDVPLINFLSADDPKDYTSRINSLSKEDQKIIDNLLTRLEE